MSLYIKVAGGSRGSRCPAGCRGASPCKGSAYCVVFRKYREMTIRNKWRHRYCKRLPECLEAEA